MISTSEAAKQLGISTRRVRALLEQGILEGEKHGRTWFVSSTSVKARASQPARVGRPAARSSNDVVPYTLLNGTHEVCLLYINEISGFVVDFEPFDTAFAPPGACPQPGTINKHFATGWLSERKPSEARPDLATLLAGKTTDAYFYDNLGLSLSDQYWLKPAASPLQWGDVSLFSNPYTDSASPHANPSNVTRSPSTGGALAKWWEQEADLSSRLVKTGHRDSVAERAATLLYKRILDRKDFVAYELITRNNETCACCKNFIHEGFELVPMEHVIRCYSRQNASYSSYVETAESLGIADIRLALSKMIACDYIMANRDRHTFNLGLVRNSETHEYVSAAPIYDNGQGFFRAAVEPDDFSSPYFYESNPFDAVPLRQLALVEDWSWFDTAALKGFAQQAAELFESEGVLSASACERMALLLDKRIEQVGEFALQSLYAAKHGSSGV